MAVDANLRGVTSGNGAEGDANGNLLINLTPTAANAGFSRLTSQTAPGISKDLEITEEGKIAVAQSHSVLSLQFNSANTAWANQIGCSATTMTKGQQSGYLRLNNSAALNVATGISVYSNRCINLDEAVQLRVRMYAKHTNAVAQGKQMDLGLGYYAFAAGQNATMNEFIGFRWTLTGGLVGVVETSQGGLPASQTININSNTPFADSLTKEYELCITQRYCEFYTDGTYQGRIARNPAAWGHLKGVSLPWIARVYNNATSTVTSAAQLDIGLVDVQRYGLDFAGQPANRAGQGRSTYYGQPDLGYSLATAVHNLPASGTAPTANAGSNTASALNSAVQLGGWYRNTLTGVSGTDHTNILVVAFTNLAIPTASGVAQNSRNLIITALTVSPMYVSTALTGGGFSAMWFAAVGATAVSLATADADGTTAVAQKAPRLVPLSLMQTLGAAAAAGTVSTDAGDHHFIFPTPLVVHPGEYLHVGFRTLAPTAITAGAVDGCIGVNGYWE